MRITQEIFHTILYTSDKIEFLLEMCFFFKYAAYVYVINKKNINLIYYLKYTCIIFWNSANFRGAKSVSESLIIFVSR